MLSICSRSPVCLGWPRALGTGGWPSRPLQCHVPHAAPGWGTRRVAEVWRSLSRQRELRLLCPFPAELDPAYRPMYSGDIPLDPIDMHMDMDGDYPMDAYSDGVRAPFADHMLA